MQRRYLYRNERHGAPASGSCGSSSSGGSDGSASSASNMALRRGACHRQRAARSRDGGPHCIEKGRQAGTQSNNPIVSKVATYVAINEWQRTSGSNAACATARDAAPVAAPQLAATSSKQLNTWRPLSRQSPITSGTNNTIPTTHYQWQRQYQQQAEHVASGHLRSTAAVGSKREAARRWWECKLKIYATMHTPR